MIDQGQRIQSLCLDWLKDEPFFAHLILSQGLVQCDDPKVCPSMGVDGLRLYFHPPFVAKLSDPELKGVLAHEALHLAYGHPWRFTEGDFQPELWNIATDAVINNVLKRRRYTLPQDGVFLGVQNHETSEEVYERLQKQLSKAQQQMPKWGTVMKPKPQDGQGKPQDGEGDGENGGLTEEEKLEAQKKVFAAAQQAREAGKMPGEYETIVERSYLGQRDWRDTLRRYLNGGHERERTWTRRSRRHTDAILPGFGPYGPGEVAVFIDTSASIDDSLANKFVTEVGKITEDMMPDKVHVVCCDARVQWARTYDGYEPIDDVRFLGRGGTDFKPPFEWLEQNGIMPKAVVYFTDLECHSFPDPTPWPVLWVVWPGGRDSAPFGEIIRMGG